MRNGFPVIRCAELRKKHTVGFFRLQVETVALVVREMPAKHVESSKYDQCHTKINLELFIAAFPQMHFQLLLI
jgi:hypothetical protein